MTVSLDEQIAEAERMVGRYEVTYGREGVKYPPEYERVTAILASLRQLQARTTALEECVERLEYEASLVEHFPVDAQKIREAAQRARKALEER